MRLTLIAAALLLTACGQSVQQEEQSTAGVETVEPGDVADALDALVIECASFSSETSEAGLRERFGAENVTAAIVPGPEGTENHATVLFASDPLRRVEILWRDEARRVGIANVSIQGDASQWAGPHGLRLGDALAIVEEKNGKPFELTGFEWDYGGTVVNWKEGALAGPPGCVQRVRFNPRASTRGAAGDSIFSSDAPAVRATNSVVSEIAVSYAQAD
jgi:hypothetical protein